MARPPRAGVRVIPGPDGKWIVQCTHRRCDAARFEGGEHSGNRTMEPTPVKAGAEEYARWHRQWHTREKARLDKEAKA